jgi:hypothetical protein
MNERQGSFWAMIITSLALLISAVVQATNKTISLYNAVIVLYFCCLHVFSSFVVLKVFRWVQGKDIDPRLTLVASLQWFLCNCFATGVLSNQRFGSQPECNSKVRNANASGFFNCEPIIYRYRSCSNIEMWAEQGA